MAHFAKVVNNVVSQVITADHEFFNNFVDDSPGEWLQCSYNTRGGIHYLPNSNTPSDDQTKALRKNYAGVGFTYDRELDAFIPPQPYASWNLNEETCLWECPVAYPEDDGMYEWNEENQSWDLVE